MAGCHDVRLPPHISYGAKGGPGFKTQIVHLSGGGERRNIAWSTSRGTWNVGHRFKTQAELDQLLAFFYARMGRAYSFRFKDWMDFRARMDPAESLPLLYTTTGTMPGSTQLEKHYDSGGFIYTREIQRPVAETVSLYGDGTLIDPSHYSLDSSTGLIIWNETYSPGPGVRITWDGEFDIPARFDTDRFESDIVSFHRYHWDGIPIIEVRNEVDVT